MSAAVLFSLKSINEGMFCSTQELKHANQPRVAAVDLFFQRKFSNSPDNFILFCFFFYSVAGLHF